jgi:hypothetical protein
MTRSQCKPRTDCDYEAFPRIGLVSVQNLPDDSIGALQDLQEKILCASVAPFLL